MEDTERFASLLFFLFHRNFSGKIPLEQNVCALRQQRKQQKMRQ